MEIEKDQVLRVIQQYLKENNLHDSLRALQAETKIQLNSVPNDQILHSIRAGKYDKALEILCDLDIKPKLLIDLYELIIKELIEMDEKQAARTLLRQTEPMEVMRNIQPDRYLELESLIAQQNPKLWQTDKQKLRNSIANELEKHLVIVDENRLLTIIGQSIKWQVSQNMISTESAYDLFKGQVPKAQFEDDAPVITLSKTIKFPKKQYAESGCFSPDGKYFVTGSVDGFIEVWNYFTGKLRTDLLYQTNENNMLMETACLCLNFSSDSEMLVSGAQDGSISVWKVSTGECVKTFSSAHTQGITFVQFAKDPSQILSASFDHTIKIHGMKSGKTLKIYKGHTSFVNSAVFSHDGSCIISGSSDGTVRIWNALTTECIQTINLANGELTSKGVNIPTVHTVIRHPKDESFIISNQSNYIYHISIKGKLLKHWKIEKSSDILAITISPSFEYIYVVNEKQDFICIGENQGNIISRINLKADIVGLKHHPFSNVIAIYTDDGNVSIWK